MKTKTSKIASMLLAVSVLFSIFSIPSAFAAAEGFQGCPADSLGTPIPQLTGTVPGAEAWSFTELTKYASATVIAEPENESNYVLKLESTGAARVGKVSNGLANKTLVGTAQNCEMSVRFRLARATEQSKAMTLYLKSASGVYRLVFNFDLMTGQVTCSNGVMVTSPANSSLYIQGHINEPVDVGEWVDFEVRLLSGDQKRAMIYANGKPLVYGADASDGTVSVSAGRPMLPFKAVTADSYSWPNNIIYEMYFSLDSSLDSDPASEKASFYIDDIDRIASSDHKSTTLINYIAPVMDEYSTTIASPKIINTDMLLPSTVRDANETVVWTSEDVTIQNNRVVLPDASEVTEAVLTATVTKGADSVSQSWTVKVAPRMMASVDDAVVEDGVLKSVTVSKKCALPESCKVLVGVCDKNTALYSAFKMLAPAADADVITLTEDVAVGTNDKVNVFVWNMNTLTPLAPAFSK